jgi:hypothetical protein
MDRLEVAFILSQMMEAIKAANNNPAENYNATTLTRQAEYIVYWSITKYWWANQLADPVTSTPRKSIFKTVKNYIDNTFELIPSKKLQAFIDFVFENKNSNLIPDSLKRFPLEIPIPLVTLNIAEFER